jgi:acyl carrier protein
VAILTVERPPVWTAREIEVVVLDLLAIQLNEDRSALERRLLDGGGDMPIDSLDLFDVLVDFRQQTGITIPKRKLGHKTMRSVRRFAQFAAGEEDQ